MYDGYYIYSPFFNKLSDFTDQQKNASTSFKEGDKISGLQPYVYYSCRYKKGNDDFVINYSLDNYITIEGIINNKWIYDAGYVLDNISDSGDTYRGIRIKEQEQLKEYTFNPALVESASNVIDTVQQYPYIKVNGVKYYKDNDPEGNWFTIMNGKKYPYSKKLDENKSNAGIQYYRDARAFKKRMQEEYHLDELKESDAVAENGVSIPEFANDSFYIFDFGSDNNSIEDPDSNFNQHRLAVVRYCIEKGLAVAISNYNQYTDTIQTDFQMPKLKEDEWEKIINNVSIISFLQGLNIGGKMYNGYSIVANNKNQELVSEQSIYILTSKSDEGNIYHRADELSLTSYNTSEIVGGYFNLDFEIRQARVSTTGDLIGYMSQQNRDNPIIGSYKSIINAIDLPTAEERKNYSRYMAEVVGGKGIDTGSTRI